MLCSMFIWSTGDGLEKVGFVLLDGFSGAGGVGSSGDFRTGAVYGRARVDCFRWFALILAFVAGVGMASSSDIVMDCLCSSMEPTVRCVDM